MAGMNAQELLVVVLERASSQEPASVKEAEFQIAQWETQPDFHAALIKIITNYSLDVPVRWIATVCLKNGIERYWRRNAPHAISESEKQLIRSVLTEKFDEPVNQIAVQRAVITAKIARIDSLKDWPEIFPCLLENVNSTDLLVQHRSLMTLYHVIKSISTKRFGADRRQFQDFTSNIYSFILNIWNTFTETFFAGVLANQETSVLVTCLEKALLTLRILRKLTAQGFYKPHENANYTTFMNLIFERIRTSLECRKQIRSRGENLTQLMEKFTTHLTKILHSELDVHPLSFVDFIRPSLELSVYYLFTSEGQQHLYERFTIQCMNLIKAVLLCPEYKPPKLFELTKHPETLRAYHIKQDFFQTHVLTEIIRSLISHYFVLKQEDLEMWDEDPELFINDEGGESWKYSLRPSIETVFATIFHEFRDTLAPVLLEMIMETNQIVSPDNMDGILKKDAVYNAVNIAAYDMYEEVDFDQWFTNTLAKELKVKDNNYRVIRRRVSALIGHWAGIKLSQELRPTLYLCMIDLLQPSEDIVVRLTASMALRHAIDDFEFNSEQFSPYVNETCTLLFGLLQSVKECETKMRVLSIMTLMIERIGQTIIHHMEDLIRFMPELWRAASDHNMLRCAIVSTMVQLVGALGAVSPEMKGFVLPIIKMGTDCEQSASVYLMEDCLALWTAVLENTATASEDLLLLCENVPIILDRTTEYMRDCFIILLRYVLLAPEVFMHRFGNAVMTCCEALMSDLRSEGIALMLKLFDKLIRVSPELGCRTVQRMLPSIFEAIYKDDDLPMLMSQYLCIVSRVILSSPAVFSETLSLLASKSNSTPLHVLDMLLNVWTKKMVNVSQLEQRKLLSLALCNLFVMQIRCVFERFPAVLKNIEETLNDVTKTDDYNTVVDSLLLSDERSPSYFQDCDNKYCDTNHDLRKKQLILSDPVYTIDLKDYVQSHLDTLRTQIGPEQYRQLLSLVESDVITHLKTYVTL